MLKAINDAEITTATHVSPRDGSGVYLDNVSSSKHFFEFTTDASGNGFDQCCRYNCNRGDTFSVKRNGSQMTFYCNTDRLCSVSSSSPFAVKTNVSLDFNFGSSPYIMGEQSGYSNVSVPLLDVRPYLKDGDSQGVESVKLAEACGYSGDSYIPFLIIARAKCDAHGDTIPLDAFEKFETSECIGTIDGLKQALKRWDKEIRDGTNNDMEAALFRTIFHVVKSFGDDKSAKEISKDTAVDMIKLVPTKWRHFDDYIRFLTTLDRETMTFAEFVYHPNLYQVYESHDDYSPSAPSLIDEFAEWQQSQ